MRGQAERGEDEDVMSNTTKVQMFSNLGVYHFAADLRAAQMERTPVNESMRNICRLLGKAELAEMGETADAVFVSHIYDGGIVAEFGLGITREGLAEMLRAMANAVEELTPDEAMESDE